MTEIAAAQDTALTPIGILAEEARIYSENMAMNMLNLGRVFTEAKKQIDHGEFGEWVRENAGMSVRSAQQLMAVYQRFGGKPAFSGIEKTKMYRMLALPEGTEDAFMEEHDVSAMSSREIEEAVKRVREEAEQEIEKERKARRAAEARVDALASRPPEIPDEVAAELNMRRQAVQERDAEIQRLADIGRESLAEKNRLTRENCELRRDLKENQTMLEEQQEEIARVQGELLNMQSAQARGDAERTPADELTLDVFAGAVRQFVGICARMPYMTRAFCGMTLTEKNRYDDLLRAVEGWCAGARKALSTVETEGAIVVE